MARILAIDYGKKRTGLAVTDPMQIIATGLTTIETPTLMAFLKNYFATEAVEKVLIGLPKNLNNTDTDATKMVQGFTRAFMREFPEMTLVEIDERFTSKMAFQTMIDSGVKKMARRDKAMIDEISATILLQGYLA
jgi:putative holliday junction resolvase